MLAYRVPCRAKLCALIDVETPRLELDNLEARRCLAMEEPREAAAQHDTG